MRIEWDKTTYIRAFLSAYIYDKMLLVMALAGTVLFILQKCNVVVVPDSLGRLHLGRTGIISFIVYCLFVWWDGIPDEEPILEEGEELTEDDEFLDE